MIKNYGAIFNYLLARNDLCLICKKPLENFPAVYAEKIDLHHKCHKTKKRILKFPLFIDSLLNLELVHHKCHLKRGGHNSITDYRAARYESFLMRHPLIAGFVNNPARKI